MKVRAPMLKCAVLVCLFMLAACGQEEPRGPSILDQPRDAPTVPPPAWVAPVEVITLETVPRIALLGRLDNPGSLSTIFDHAIAPDSTRLAGLDSRQITVWDLISGEEVFSTGRQEEVTRVFFSPDKTEVYAVELNGTVSVHDAETGRLNTTFLGIEQYTGVIAYYPDDGWLAFANDRGDVRIWDPLERRALTTIPAHSRGVTRLIFSADGTQLATADTSGEVRVWDWESRATTAEVQAGQPALALALAREADLLAVGLRDSMQVWSLADSALLHTLDTGPGAIEIMMFSPDGRYLINGGETPDMQVWNPQDGSLVARLPEVGGDRLAAAFAPGGDLLLTTELGGAVSLWNMTTITENTVNRADLDLSGTLIYSADWTPDGLLMALFGATGSVYLWGIPAA